MLSVIVKTVVIFLLVVIVTHLIIRKSLSTPYSPPPPTDHVDHMQDGIEEKKEPDIDVPVVHSSTNIQPPTTKSTNIDDLFNYVYKDNAAKERNEVAKPIPTPDKKVAENSNPKPSTSIEGLCAFEDEGTSLYGMY